jgi:predicted phosphodiesterase
MKFKPFKSLADQLSFIYCNIRLKISNKNNFRSNNYLLSFDSSGNFKIVQFSDIQDGPNTNPQTLELMNRILDKEKPNLVVLTGDNVDGKCKTSKDVITAITNIAEPMESRNIPWAVVFGNHDDEHFMMNKEQMMNFYMSFNYNVSQIGFRTGTRIGNYNLLVQGTSSQAPEFNIYLLDSGKFSFLGIYDYITKPQICWYKTMARKLKNQYKRVIPAIMFFHIPLQEFYMAYQTGHIDGERLEHESASLINTGFFDTIVNTGDVKSIFVGHDHNNTYSAVLDNIRLGYAGSVGYATYGNPKLQRSARIFEINEANPSAIKTRLISAGDVGLE